MITLKKIEAWKAHKVRSPKQTPSEILKELKFTKEELDLAMKYCDKDIKTCPMCHSIMVRTPKGYETLYNCINCPNAER